MRPEAIGLAGELKFDELCNEVSINSSTQSPDLNGIDRYVELPQSKIHPFLSLDARPAALSCYVQIKTISHNQTRWRISLSNAEKLAKHPKPTFLVLFKLNANNKVTWGGIAHFQGKLLTRTLERLRRAEYDKQFDLNRINLTLTQEEAEPFDLTGAALQEKLKLAIGDNMALYIQKKELELSSVGFDSERLKAVINYENVSLEDLIDAQLNETPISFSNMEFSEKRFNISLPTFPHPLMNGKITIEPTKYENCQFIVESCDTGDGVSLPCSVHIAALPDIIKNHYKAKILTNTLALELTPKGFHLTYPRIFDETFPQLVGTWKNTFKLVDLLTRGKCRLLLQRHKNEEAEQLGVTTEFHPTEKASIAFLKRLSEATMFLLKEANTIDEPAPLPQLVNNSREILSAYAALNEKVGNTPIQYKLTKEQASQHPSECDLLYVHGFMFNNRTFAYAVRTTTQQITGTYKFKTGKLEPVLLKELNQKHVLEEYKEFSQKVRRITAIKGVILETQMLDIAENTAEPT